jgi:DNA-binding MarR family transcriptional regulator
VVPPSLGPWYDEVVVLREVVRGLRAGQTSVYPEDIQDVTGLRRARVQAAATALERRGMVDVVRSEHFGVLRFVGVHAILRPLTQGRRDPGR